jgi:hypothetical protein
VFADRSLFSEPSVAENGDQSLNQPIFSVTFGAKFNKSGMYGAESGPNCDPPYHHRSSHNGAAAGDGNIATSSGSALELTADDCGDAAGLDPGEQAKKDATADSSARRPSRNENQPSCSRDSGPVFGSDRILIDQFIATFEHKQALGGVPIINAVLTLRHLSPSIRGQSTIDPAQFDDLAAALATLQDARRGCIELNNWGELQTITRLCSVLERILSTKQVVAAEPGAVMSARTNRLAIGGDDAEGKTHLPELTLQPRSELTSLIASSGVGARTELQTNLSPPLPQVRLADLSGDDRAQSALTRSSTPSAGLRFDENLGLTV